MWKISGRPTKHNQDGREIKKFSSAEFETLCRQMKSVSRHFSWDLQEIICEQHKGLPIPNIDKADFYNLRQTAGKGYGNQVIEENLENLIIS